MRWKLIIEILDATKKKDFLKNIDYLGDFKLPYLFLKAGEQTRIFSGHLAVGEILKIWRTIHVEGIGLYFGKQFIDRHGAKETRISLDGLHVVKDQITKNTLTLDKDQVEKWFQGLNVELNAEQKESCKDMKNQYVAVSNGTDFIGTGKLSENFILLSFLPKERRRHQS